MQFDPERRKELWSMLISIAESYLQTIDQHRVTPVLDVEEIRAFIRSVDFTKALAPEEAIKFAARGLWQYQTHTPHPRYFGLFNPAPHYMGIAADTLVATFNPQLAAWSHNPFAVEIEQHVIRQLGSRFGWPIKDIDGTFASGGAEANHTAVLAALTSKIAQFATNGLGSLRPVLYLSAEGHHSFIKAARLCGLGDLGARQIPVDSALRIDLRALESAIQNDRSQGMFPFLIVGTAGTTSSGAIDDLQALAGIAHREDAWFHVDAAWGGAAILVPELRKVLEGVELADSITFDAHKWLSVPMGAGIFLTKHPAILNETFSTSNPYMPDKGTMAEVVDPYAHSMQWSRRFIGLKVFLSLAVSGWEGYEKVIRHQTELGHALRVKLRAAGWKVINATELPLVCFLPPAPVNLQEFVLQIWERGNVWISHARLANGQDVLRACITNFRTTEQDLDALIQELETVRQRIQKSEFRS